VSRKNKWVPILVEMSTRIRNDGRTSLEKAQVQKKKEDLDDIYCKGKTKKSHKSSAVNNLTRLAKTIGVNLGESSEMVENNLEVCVNFDEARLGVRVNTPGGGGALLRV
jgi:prophage antirepressor-like protein